MVIDRTLDASNQDYAFCAIAEEALSGVVAVDHPRKRKLSFAQLLKFPWILQPRGSPMRDVLEREFAANGMPLPAGLIETASILSTTNLVAKTQLIAVIAHRVASRYATHGLLAILPYRLSHALAKYGSIVRKDRLANLAATRFLALLHDSPK